jgi:hypothetical protein
MAKHRARSNGRRTLSAVLVTAAATVAAAVIGVQSANAILLFPDNKTVSPKNSDVFGKCILQVKKVDPAHSYAVTIKLSGQAQPNNPNGYADNVFTQVDCYLLPAGDTNPADHLAQIHPNANSATVLNTSTTVTVPYATSYTLCGQAWVKKVNGDTTTTGYICA